MFKSKDRKAQKVQAALEKKAEIVYAAATSAAKAAKKAGRKVFQYMDVVSITKGEVIPMVGAFTKDEQGFTKGIAGEMMGRRVLATPIEIIENEGWHLVDAGYVYQQTHAESRDKFMASGQQEAYSGRVLGIYTFRLAEKQ